MSRELVDPELLSFLDSFPQIALSASTLETFRSYELTLPANDRAEQLIDVEEMTCNVQGGRHSVRFLLYRPHQSMVGRGAYLHIHGGGFVMGAPEMHDARNRELSAKAGCIIASVDYRLAPENHYPDQVEDCYAVLSWLHQNAQTLGIDSKRIGVGGESAGGGLAAALALLARDRKEFSIAFQLLVYPMLDDRTGVTQAVSEHVGEFLWSVEANRFAWKALLGDLGAGPNVPAYAAAARAADFSGLPPIAMFTGALDLFVEEDIHYATRALNAGVPTELHVYPGVYHAFNLVAEASVSKQFNRDFEDAFVRFLTPKK